MMKKPMSQVLAHFPVFIHASKKTQRSEASTGQLGSGAVRHNINGNQTRSNVLTAFPAADTISRLPLPRLPSQAPSPSSGQMIS